MNYKIVKCPLCKREREVPKDMIISICSVCQEEMLEVKR